MKGFLRRDLCLLGLNGRFYLVFLLVMGVLCFFSDLHASLLSLYVVVFCVTALVGLFNYDEFNQWQGYAAASPGGRTAPVDARYVTALLLSVAVTVLLLVFSRLERTGYGWAMALVYGAVILLYVAVVFPLTYRFGAKSRLMIIIVLAAIAGGVGVGGSALVSADGVAPELALFPLAAAALWTISLAGLTISWQISRKIMGKKEL